MNTIKTLVKYTLIGIASAIVVLYFIQNDAPLNRSSSVTFSEISIDDAHELAQDTRKTQGNTTYSNAVKTATPAVVNI